MTTITVNESIRNAISSAVLFSQKSDSGRDGRLQLICEEGHLKVLCAPSRREAYLRVCSADISGTGCSVTVNGCALLSVIADEKVKEMQLSEAGVSLTGDGISSKVFPMDCEESSFALARDDTETACARIPFSTLRRGIREVLYARSEREFTSSYATYGVTVRCFPGKLEVFAMDSSKAACFTASCETKGDSSCVIPADVASFISAEKWQDVPSDANCFIRLGGGIFSLEVNNTYIFSPTVAGNICDISRITGISDTASIFTLSAKELADTASRVISLSPTQGRGSGKNAAAVFSLNADSIICTYRGLSGEMQEVIPARGTLREVCDEMKNERKIALNAKQLKDCLTSFGGEEVSISADLTLSKRSVLFKPAHSEQGIDRTHILMPVVLKKTAV